MYSIDKNVPLPPSRRGAKAKYPFASMQLGDSILVPDDGSRRAQMRLGSAANMHFKRTGKKFATRREGMAVRVLCIRDNDVSIHSLPPLEQPVVDVFA